MAVAVVLVVEMHRAGGGTKWERSFKRVWMVKS